MHRREWHFPAPELTGRGGRGRSPQRRSTSPAYLSEFLVQSYQNVSRPVRKSLPVLAVVTVHNCVSQTDLEGIMARRRIGQDSFHFGAKAEGTSSLDNLAALIDWPQAERVLAGLYASAKGEKAWPPLAMCKALLLATGS
jgi:hypothetical protein